MVKKMKYKLLEEIQVFKDSHLLTLKVFKITGLFPKTEMYGLISQLRRAASSIPANIAEGYGRRSTKELIQYLYNARGSCSEIQYHILLSRDLGFVSPKEYEELKDGYDQIGKQLNGWINSLRTKL